jgi:hypothetical protein
LREGRCAAQKDEDENAGNAPNHRNLLLEKGLRFEPDEAGE